jgi:RNA polymerase sigma factor (RpoD-like family)
MLNSPKNHGLIDREYNNSQVNSEVKPSVLKPLNLSSSDPVDPASSFSSQDWTDSIAWINEDTVGLFLKEMARYPLLSAEEEVILSRQVQEGINLQRIEDKILANTGEKPTISDLACASGLGEAEITIKLKQSQIAKQKMVRSNLRLVVSIAKRYVNRGVPFLDLIQEGALGLNRAAEKFDPEKGYKFSTYAYWWIRQGITRTLANHGRTVRLPIHVVEKLNKMRVMQQQLRQKFERNPSEAELAEALEISIPQLRYLHQVRRRSLSLNHRFGEDQDTELLDLLEDQGTQSPEAQISETMMRQEILSVLSDVLTEREKDIISLRYGLSTGKPYTLEEVSHLFNLSRERVRQIQTKAMRKLRRPQVAQRLKAWLR